MLLLPVQRFQGELRSSMALEQGKDVHNESMARSGFVLTLRRSGRVKKSMGGKRGGGR